MLKKVTSGQADVGLVYVTDALAAGDQPHGRPRNTVDATVAELNSRGPAVRVDEQPDGAPGLAADITTESAAEMRLAPGYRVYVSVKAQEVTIYPSP